MGIASLVLGIISFLVSFSIFKDLALICGVIAIVLGIIAIVRKKGRGIAIAGVILSVVGCIVLFSSMGEENTGTITESGGTDPGNDAQPAEVQTLNVGDTWTVDGQWKLTIDSVTTTPDRNQFADINPQQVVIVTYSYENLGYENDIMDGLYFDLNMDASVVDAAGEMAVSYPGNISKHPQETPVGAKCTGAQSCIGLMNASDTITMKITKYDGNGNSQSIDCNLKVE